MKGGCESGAPRSAPSSSAIIGGHKNRIETPTDGSNAAIGADGVRLKSSKNTVVAAIRLNPKSNVLSEYDETLITRHIKAFGDIQAQDGSFDTISAKHISGSMSQSSAIISNADVTITPETGLDIIYANPIPGPVVIRLGEPKNHHFNDNQVIIIKDVTPEYGPNTSHDVYITVPSGNIRIEYYGTYNIPGITGTYSGIVAGTGGTYILNSAGGSVTFRYMPSGTPGALPTWVIQNQLIGNPRVKPISARGFAPSTDLKRSKILDLSHPRRAKSELFH